MPDHIRTHVEALIVAYHARQITAKELHQHLRYIILMAGLELPAPQSTHDA